MPNVFWLSSSDAEIARARSLLKSLTPQGVLDELGFLVLLGAFSDRLYPAINTIMTRARYLVFVPAIFRHIEQRKLAKQKNAEGVSRQFQFALCTALIKTDSRQPGIIGREAGRSVVRPPSNIYWTALADLGIATSRISESSYLEQLSETRLSSAMLKDDDGVVHVLDDQGFWDPSFPTMHALSKTGEFGAGTSLALAFDEAKALQLRYQSVRPDGGESLLSYLLTLRTRERDAQVDFDMPWEVPNLPEPLHHVVEHARRLSLFARGASLQYHALLFEKKRRNDPGTKEAFTAWWRQSKNDLATWNLKDFANIPCVARGHRVGDIAFLEDWRIAVASAVSGESAYQNPDARECLRRREAYVRGPKARLRSKYHLRTWIEPTYYDPNQLYALAFRHRTGSQFALDITAGLRKGA